MTHLSVLPNLGLRRPRPIIWDSRGEPEPHVRAILMESSALKRVSRHLRDGAILSDWKYSWRRQLEASRGVSIDDLR
jgi:hypothetical protein